MIERKPTAGDECACDDDAEVHYLRALIRAGFGQWDASRLLWPVRAESGEARPGLVWACCLLGVVAVLGGWLR